MKKVLTLFLALTLTLMMALPVLAEGAEKGTITIKDAVVGQKYTIYRILDLESYGGEAYAYKATTEWTSFIQSEDIANKYLKVNDAGYVEWVGDNTAARAEAFAKLAKENVKASGLEGEQSKTAESETVVFNNLPLGYYLVDSTLGVLCSLDTTNSSVEMKEKNVPPTNEKKVEEDSNHSFGDENDADIGQTVTFKSIITVNANNKNYVFHDKMYAGLTFDKVESVQLKKGETTTTVTADGNYEVIPQADIKDECTFEVEFSHEFCDALEADEQIIITYTATLNENAVVGGEGNPNESWLKYGESSDTTSSTPHDKTITYTWDMDVLKYANSDEAKVLADVKFALLNSDKSKAAIVVNGKVTGWTAVPTGDAKWPDNTVLTTGTDGKISIDGLDADTYYLHEIETLPGYNKLAEDVEVKIAPTTENSKLTYTTKEVKVNNNSGVEMPSTGGIGTTIFYVAGGLLVAVAVVLLVTKKKMSATK